VGVELGVEGHAVSLPLHAAESVRGYLVLVFDPDLPGHVELALATCFDELAPALVARAPRPVGKLERPLAVVS